MEFIKKSWNIGTPPKFLWNPFFNNAKINAKNTLSNEKPKTSSTFLLSINLSSRSIFHSIHNRDGKITCQPVNPFKLTHKNPPTTGNFVGCKWVWYFKFKSTVGCEWIWRKNPLGTSASVHKPAFFILIIYIFYFNHKNYIKKINHKYI